MIPGLKIPVGLPRSGIGVWSDRLQNSCSIGQITDAGNEKNTKKLEKIKLYFNIIKDVLT
jgi:hypothetical protein